MDDTVAVQTLYYSDGAYAVGRQYGTPLVAGVTNTNKMCIRDSLEAQGGGRLLYYDANSANTPYKAGITQASEGVAITVDVYKRQSAI